MGDSLFFFSFSFLNICMRLVSLCLVRLPFLRRLSLATCYYYFTISSTHHHLYYYNNNYYYCIYFGWRCVYSWKS